MYLHIWSNRLPLLFAVGVKFLWYIFLGLQVGSPDTDSSLDALSPVPGTGFWDPDISLVSLHKGEEGLGFSILDFAVS